MNKPGYTHGRPSIALALALILSLFGLSRCYSPGRSPASMPQQPDQVHWNEVLQRPPVIRWRILQTGTVHVPLSGMMNLEDPKMAGMEDKPIDVLVMAHLLQRKDGAFLIDTGLDDSFSPGHKARMWGPLLRTYVLDWQQNPGQDLGSQLQRLQITPEAVFFTHLHSDHTAGVPALSEDTEFYVGKGDTFYNLPFIYRVTHLDGVQTLHEIDCAHATRAPILGSVIDIFGDGSLWAICTPGHSAGHLSYLAITTDGPVLFTGDASHTRKGFEMGIEPGWVDDREEAKRSLEKLRKFAATYPQVRVVYGHEL
ncbi:MAG: MBL fold metallo-hydrolase [Leptospiraceae bacterium]|nr:MBL fold metallo-hydrolase [Leptospiraceae bacterium]